ncbi:hypothetical protein niasHT_003397 [Heterodera trifolii]|uniref:BTB domain-containing protein n=1 Tax=Heterodera trifolii TaxID=157864 RepID=A0ABD2LNQ5_9BILA
MDKLTDRMKRLLSTGVDADVQFLLLPAHKPILRVASVVFDAMFRYDDKFAVTQTPADEKAFLKEGNSPVEIPDVDVEAFKTMLSFIYADDLSGLNGHNAIDALRWAKEKCRQNGIECSAENYRQMLGPALYKIRFLIINKHFLADIASSGVLTSDELVSVLLCHSCYSSSSTKALAYSGGAGPQLYPLPFSDHRRSAKSKGKLSLKIEKFSEFARQKELSRKYTGTKYLGFFIQCNADDYGSDWSCTCLATIRVVPQNGNKKTKSNDGSKRIYQSFWPKDKECWGFSKFVAFQKLMDPEAGWYNKEKDTVTLSADVGTVGRCDYIEKNSPVLIPDVDAEAFKVMLRFIYSDDLSELNGKNAVELLYAALKFNVIGLIKAFTDFSISKLSNVFDALSIARFNDLLKDFFQRCLAYIDKKADILLKSMEFLQITNVRQSFELFHNRAMWNSRGYTNFISFAELMDPEKGFYDQSEDKVTLAIDVTVKEPKMEDKS